MGAWGTKTFEEDTALDWIAELEDSENARAFLFKCFDVANEDETLDSETGTGVLCAAEAVVGILDEPRPALPESLAEWLEDNECDDVSDLPELAVTAIDKVLSDGSEFNAVWQEAEDYDEWRNGVEELRELLVQIAES